MKIITIFIFTLSSMLLITFGLDLLIGIDRSLAISNLLNPFWVMEPFEYFIIALLAAIPLVSILVTFLSKKKKLNED
ncbi:alkaline shock response membrane anchor protein AmaP [Halobacillus sp. A5]|uniref:alkaline shock response membrane anchor protein AmaP n=1 Tax=Halobacillus sp. A5 TaxID=2880263 RepID=UPI0020A65FE9|nr:alkaline shock response membrane anchor protein AmaP [Halobacillus sp. A5]MCP3026580.1 alkaline shock response membrane anchor protein AmaP [Halobacillus sp. A5]